MERKLASIQRVLRIEPIANADAIELAHINGWQCVTKKGEFQPGDLGVYFEIDAIPPDQPPFQFLWKPKAKPDEPIPESFAQPKNFRIRTIKLRGELSQGLLMPLATLNVTGEEGDDLTTALGVLKYEPPISFASGECRGSFPGFVPKTDEIRVQSEPRVLQELAHQPYVITLKCDGTSATFCVDPRDNSFHACSRNMSIKDGDNLYWRIVRKFDLEAGLRAHPQWAIQGEIVGPGVQKNRLGLRELTMFGFSVFDLNERRFLDHDDAERAFAKLGVPMVALIERGESFQHSQASLLALAEGFYPNTKNEREGIVIRPQHEMKSTSLRGRLSFKAISNRFLLKEGD